VFLRSSDRNDQYFFPPENHARGLAENRQQSFLFKNSRSQQTGMKEVLSVSLRRCAHATFSVAIHYALHAFSL
jgi:hypothetical protein